MASSGFWWILLAAALYGALHSLLASNRFKRAAAALTGERAYRRYYRLFFSVMGAVTALPVLAMVALLPDQPIYSIPSPWRWAALALQGAAVVGLAASILQTGLLGFIGLRQLIDPDDAAEGLGNEKLVVSGLYRWVRHPLYALSLVLLWFTPVMTWNWLALSVGFSAYLLVGAYFFEEPKLLEQFGKPYEDYRRRTPMIIPGLKLRLSRK